MIMLSFNVDAISPTLWKIGIGAACVIGSGLALHRGWKLVRKYKCFDGKTKGETDNPYETVKLLNEYLAFSYGDPSVNCLFDGPQDGFDFPKRTAEVCLKYYKPVDDVPNRALDVGCAVGCASFELSEVFSEVIGIDFSHAFVNTCNALKQNGKMEYEVLTEGSLTTKHEACIPLHLKREHCYFHQGDACNLPLDLGKFGCVLAANLICRLPDPLNFLLRLPSLVSAGGICVIISPYTFLEEYTKKSKWLGGFVDDKGQEVRAFDNLKQVLGTHFELVDEIDMPFLIRETAREHQWTVSHATIWKRNDN